VIPILWRVLLPFATSPWNIARNVVFWGLRTGRKSQVSTEVQTQAPSSSANVRASGTGLTGRIAPSGLRILLRKMPNENILQKNRLPY
jgi:hypothetical protein